MGIRYKSYGMLGKKQSKESIEKMRLSKLGVRHPLWKGDDAGYSAIHSWVRRNKPKSAFCEVCKVKSPQDIANISQLYKRDINDYEWLCRRCHMTKDGRLAVFLSINWSELNSRKIEKIICRICGKIGSYRKKVLCKKCYDKERDKRRWADKVAAR